MSIAFDNGRWENFKRNARKWRAGELGRPLINMNLTGCRPGRSEPKLSGVTFDGGTENFVVFGSAPLSQRREVDTFLKWFGVI